MAGVFTITTAQLGSVLRAESKKMRRCADTAVERASRRFQEWLRHHIDNLGITHTGGYRDSIVVTTTSGRATIYSDHPAAGVIEMGCGPHPVSIAGQQSIRMWCIEKLGVPEEDADRITFLICRKIREFGQEARYVFRDAIPMLFRFFREEFAVALKRERV